MREWHARDEAWQRARSFARRFGEPHVRLAMHGAVPIGLTPELLHLIRVNFVTATPWVAESDLLLSPLCRDVGGGFFEMDEELRGLLVEELQRDPDFGPRRLRDVADFLGAWADRVRESASDQEWSDFVEGQALTALSYRKPEEAAEALARSLNTPQRGRAGIDARVIKLTQGLSSALMSQVEVVTYAVALDKLAAGDVEAALERFGALGPIDQPVKIGRVELPAAVEWAVTAQGGSAVWTTSEGVAEAKQDPEDVELIGESEAMRQVRAVIGRIAHTDSSVFILGETGAGKTLVARAIHQASKRSGNPFVTIDCGALSETQLEEELFGTPGLSGSLARKANAFEAAQGGTLFLDEIAEFPQALQPRLLSVLQEPELTRVGSSFVPVNVRILAATNRDLEGRGDESGFLKELYRQLNVASINMPPLRERREDVMLLAEHFAFKFSRKAQRQPPGIPPEVRERLLGYKWPGNVRELENVMERVVIQGSDGEISVKDLPPEIRDVSDARGRILIAYSSNIGPDRNVSARIAESLSSGGYAVFEAPQDLVDDSGITRMILSRLRESKAVIVVYSALSKRGEWLSLLVDFALRENVPLLPVVTPGISGGEIPPPLVDINHLLWKESDPESSLRSLRSALDNIRQPVAQRPGIPNIYISCARERWLGTMIREHLEKRGGSVWLEDRNVPPRQRGEPSLEVLLRPGNLMIVIVSEREPRNEWLQEEVSAALEFGARILPIRIGNARALPPPLNRLAKLPWIDAGARPVPDVLADIDRYIAAFDPRSLESTDDIYIETAAARDARRSVLSGSSLIVTGARRSGKTALLRYLQRSLAEQGIVAQYVGQDQKYDVTSNAVLLVDDVENLKEVVDRFSRSQRQIQTVLATRAASGIGELYKRGLIVELQDLTLDETNELNRRLGFPLRPHQVEELFDLLDGHPYLTRAAITAAARGLPVEVATASRFQPIEEELDLLDHELGAEDLRRAWESLLSGVSLDKEAQNALLALGLAKKRKGELVPRNRLYREFFAEPRRDLHTVLISTPDRNLPCARAVRTWLENHNTEVLEFDEFGSPPESYDPHVEHLLNRAELVVGLIAEPFGGRGNLAEIEMAFERYRREGRPKVFAVLVQRGGPPSELLGEIRFSRWDSDADTPILLQELAALLGEDGPSPFEESPGAAE